jgi:hypothetical protein
MCDVSDYAVGAVLDQSMDKKQYPIKEALSYILRREDSNWTPTEVRHNIKGTSCRGICHQKV